MSPSQIELLKRLIEADRRYHSKLNAKQLAHPDERGVEVGWISGVNPRTAKTLIDAGLAESTDLYAGNEYIFLGKIKPFDEVDAQG